MEGAGLAGLSCRAIRIPAHAEPHQEHAMPKLKPKSKSRSRSKLKIKAGARPAKRGRSGATAPATPVRIARVAKGKRPQYFSDPATDKLLSMTLTLMEELSVTRDRLDTVERLLTRQRVLARGAIDSFVPVAAVAVERAARRNAYVDRMLRSAQAELEEMTRKDMPKSEDDVVAAVSG